MESSFTISKLARAADVPVSTIRYYEQRGLLAPEMRTPSSYRIYGPESLKRLRFIRAAQVTGFTLEDIALLLELRDGKADPCGEVGALVEERLEHVTRQLGELRRVQRVLRSTVEWCREPKVRGCCQVIEDLDAQASRDRPRGRRTKPS